MDILSLQDENTVSHHKDMPGCAEHHDNGGSVVDGAQDFNAAECLNDGYARCWMLQIFAASQ